MFPKCGQNVKEVCPKGNFLDFAFDTIITVKGETIIKKKKQNRNIVFRKENDHEIYCS